MIPGEGERGQRRGGGARCGGTPRIIHCMEDRAVIEKILAHRRRRIHALRVRATLRITRPRCVPEGHAWDVPSRPEGHERAAAHLDRRLSSPGPPTDIPTTVPTVPSCRLGLTARPSSGSAARRRARWGEERTRAARPASGNGWVSGGDPGDVVAVRAQRAAEHRGQPFDVSGFGHHAFGEEAFGHQPHVERHP